MEIQAVKTLGEQIGYGNMMSMASALWRKSLAESGYPVIGACVPTISYFVQEEYQEMTEKDSKHYDLIIKRFL